jgi:hypothetical protein
MPRPRLWRGPYVVLRRHGVSILRQHRRESNYSVVSNDLIRDGRLTWAARGMLVYLLSMPDGWEVRETHLVAACSAPRQGIDAVRKVVAELEAAGYMRRGWDAMPGRGRVRVTELSDIPMFSGGSGSDVADLGITDVGKSNAIVNTLPSASTYTTSTDSTMMPAEPAHPRNNPLRLSIYKWLGLGDGTGAPKSDHVNVARLAAIYSKASEGPADVDADSKAWYAQDWRGRQGQPPSPSQAQTWRVQRRNATTNGHARPGAHEPAQTYVPATADQIAAIKASLGVA